MKVRAKSFIVGGVTLALLTFAISASALTQEEALAQLQSLYERIASLNALLQSSQNTSSTPSVGGTCVVLTSNLGPTQGDTETGGAVSVLQRFLKSTGDYTYPEITGYFGAATEAAVGRLQARAGIAQFGSAATNGFGAVGPRTREYIRTTSCNTSGTIATPIPQPVPRSCTIDGVSVESGKSVKLYSTRTVPGGLKCDDFSGTRTCTNGTLSNETSFQYSSCNVTGGSTCAVGVAIMASGESRRLYDRAAVAFGESCESHSQVRSCINGTLSGSATFTALTCTTPTASSCTINGITIPHGSSTPLYSATSVAFGSSCSSVSQLRTCTNGLLGGSDVYKNASCSSAAGLSCAVGSPAGTTTVTDKTTQPFYFAQNVPANELCSSYAQLRTCTNGVMSGSNTYKYGSCTPVSSTSCALDNVVLATGASGDFYSAAIAPSGKTCPTIKLTRTCTNGSLGGNASYNRASCVDDTACTLDGLTLVNASSSLFYSARTVDFGKTCAAISQTRVCTNGDLSGSETYLYASCNVNPPVAGVAQYLAAAYTAIESLIASLNQFLMGR